MPNLEHFGQMEEIYSKQLEAEKKTPGIVLVQIGSKLSVCSGLVIFLNVPLEQVFLIDGTPKMFPANL